MWVAHDFVDPQFTPEFKQSGNTLQKGYFIPPHDVTHALTDYFGNMGSDIGTLHGVFGGGYVDPFNPSKVYAKIYSSPSISDGTSNTLLASEMRLNPKEDYYPKSETRITTSFAALSPNSTARIFVPAPYNL